jgi:hypothetical protein
MAPLLRRNAYLRLKYVHLSLELLPGHWSQKVPLSKDGHHLAIQYILVNGRTLIYLSRVSFQL